MGRRRFCGKESSPLEAIRELSTSVPASFAACVRSLRSAPTTEAVRCAWQRRSVNRLCCPLQSVGLRVACKQYIPEAEWEVRPGAWGIFGTRLGLGDTACVGVFRATSRQDCTDVYRAIGSV